MTHGFVAPNDNDPLDCLDALTGESQRWLVDKLDLMEWTEPKLEDALAKILPEAVAGNETLEPQEWLQCLLYFETLLLPMPDEKLIDLQDGACKIMERLVQGEGLEAATNCLIKQSRQHEKIVRAMIAEDIYEPMLAVELGMLEGLRDGFRSDYPTLREFIDSTAKLTAYCCEDQHEALPHLRWQAFGEIIECSNLRIDGFAPPRPPATVIDLPRITPKPPSP